MNRSFDRILLVSYHFGPHAATGGFRWTRLVPHLIARGWSFDVLTNDPPGPNADDALRVHRVAVPPAAERLAWLPGTVPGALLRLLRGGQQTPVSAPAVRDTPVTTIATVDPSQVKVPTRGQTPSLPKLAVRALDGLADETRLLGWARAAAAQAAVLASQHRYRAVVVSTPPHASHEAGLLIARRTGIPYIADFRDPWVLGIGESARNANPIHRMLGEWIEPRVNDEAVAVVHNTDIEVRVIGAERPASRALRRSIPNGHDMTEPPAMPTRDRFILTYTGHLHPWMDPRPFFAACQRLFTSRPEMRATAEIHFMGTPTHFGGVDLRGLAAAYGLTDNFRFRARGTREEANALQESAAVLLAYDCTHPLCIPAKFFDYAYMRGAMLLLGHPEGAMAEAARPLGLSVIAAADAAGIDLALSRAFDRWRLGELTQQNDAAGLYARARQAEAWDALLREVAPSR